MFTRRRQSRADGRREQTSQEEPDVAFDVTHYFIDEVKEPWRQEDGLERARLEQHAALRELVARGEAGPLRARLAALGPEAGLLANLTPGGANTLLYVAAEAGHAAAVEALLEAGADGRAHPVTRYCPLYAACYHGHLHIARLLLQHFPEAVQQETVERWLPLHAACIGGHAPLVSLLLQFPYPESLLSTYTDSSGKWQFRFAFDPNACDAGGQSALYVACTLGNLAVVDALLAHTAPATPSPNSIGEERSERAVPPVPAPAPASAAVVSPHRAGISVGIHAIVSRLTGAATQEAGETREGERRVSVVRCEVGRGADSCLAAAVRGGHERVARRLLDAGASPDAPAEPPAPAHPVHHTYDDARGVGEAAREAGAAAGARRRSRSAAPAPGPARAARHLTDCAADNEGGWTALALAAHGRHARLCELLLARGATDPGGRALRECARHDLPNLLAALLAARAYPDPEHKVNRGAVAARVFGAGARGRDAALTYSALCPAAPVLLNWRDLRCDLTHLRMSWVRDACLRANSRLAGAAGAASALHALTRLDVSNNELRELPPELFSLLSLRWLSAAQNKLERLPAERYTAPVLQELYLQDNRLEEVPGAVFALPALGTLDVSNNKLRALPAELWGARALRDLNAALNHLRDLPAPDRQPEEEPTACAEAAPPSPAASPSTAPQDLAFPSRWPRRSSSESAPPVPAASEVPTLGDRTGNTVCREARRVHEWRGALAAPAAQGRSALASLNLAHNQLAAVPAALACCAPALQRLNMSYNSLRSMSFVTSYPAGLRQLDLSHNEITCWPSLPQVERIGSSEGDPLACYCAGGGAGGGRGRGQGRVGRSVRARLLAAACPARRHLRLDALRTLILSNNLLTRIQLTTDDDGLCAPHDTDPGSDDEWGSGAGTGLRARLLFPLLSMLDVSCNLLRAVPPHIHELTNLSVLNLSGNKDITELPPQMGLLSRLWNLGTAGCALGEPLRSMVAGGRYKSMDVVGYLKSVLQEAKPYTRMKLMLVGVQGIGKTSLLECLRQESAIQHRRKPTDHWARRMGNRSARGNVSTVGVDIGTWVYERPRVSARGPVTFRTWDFAGQQEYYATHQYFLSKRSLYLVLWRVPDGRRGLAAALDWLRSIQARAPGAPVIMVGTHYDQIDPNVPESESPEALQRLIRGAIMGAPDADKLGLPRVLDTIEVSCSTRHNVRLLADIIYSVAFSVKPPGSKEPLLEQRVPASYVALEDVVTALAHDLKEPVLRHDDYKRLVAQYMQQKNYRPFRDAAELRQATMFLHDNGVLLHYDDATLKELYFVRPQWLCDVLAHVVTVREINPFACNGIMKTEDLAHVLKASPELARGEEASALGLSLLNKFELALCWDARLLLVPPLLPAAEPAQPQLALRSRGWAGVGRGTPRRWPPAPAAPFPASPAPSPRPSGTDSPTLIQECGGCGVRVHAREGGRALRRLLLLSYVPRGFWPRLCTRLLADDALPLAVPSLYAAAAELDIDEATSKALELNWAWKLWKTGLKLVCGELVLLSLREWAPRADALLGALQPPPDDDLPDEPYSNLRLRVRQEGAWSELAVAASACVEILLPAPVCVVRRDDGAPISGYQVSARVAYRTPAHTISTSLTDYSFHQFQKTTVLPINLE